MKKQKWSLHATADSTAEAATSRQRRSACCSRNDRLTDDAVYAGSHVRCVVHGPGKCGQSPAASIASNSTTRGASHMRIDAIAHRLQWVELARERQEGTDSEASGCTLAHALQPYISNHLSRCRRVDGATKSENNCRGRQTTKRNIKNFRTHFSVLFLLCCCLFCSHSSRSSDCLLPSLHSSASTALSCCLRLVWKCAWTGEMSGAASSNSMEKASRLHSNAESVVQSASQCR